MFCCRRRRRAVVATPVAADDLEEDLPPLELALRCLDTCAVCQEEGEVLNLACQHTYCCDCLRGQLSARWPGQRVTFGYLNCGICRQPLEHEEATAELAPHHALKQKVAAAALEGFREDGLFSELSQELGRWPSDQEARDRAGEVMAVQLCGGCGKPYCAGRVDCAAQAEADQHEQLCPDCEWTARGWNKARCMVHGYRHAIYKCDSCCDIAVWSCHSNRYCDRCHNEAGDPKHYPCPGPELCPLGGEHPPNRTAVHGASDKGSFVIGCRACMGFLDDEGADFSAGSMFGYPQRDWLSFKSVYAVLRAVPEKELLDRFDARPRLVRAAGMALREVASRLLVVEQKEQRATQANRTIHAQSMMEPEEREDAEEARMVDLEHEEAKALSPLDDVRLAREVRERARGTSALRGRRRRQCLEARAERRAACMLLARSQVKGRRGARFAAPQRGGRRKLPAVGRCDLDAGPAEEPDADRGPLPEPLAEPARPPALLAEVLALACAGRLA